MKLFKTTVLFLLIIASAWTFHQATRPTIYLIGDSTVKNGKGKGDGGLWGWGNFLYTYFDTTKIVIENDALGGTSSRTFQTRGLWDKVLEKVKPGDYVIMQFGHNDSSPLVDSTRARGTIKGIGNESKDLYNPLTKKQEVIYTYGWYMRKFIKDTKAKGATPIICSPVPLNKWKEGKIVRDSSAYAKWAKETAISEHIDFIALNELISNQYDKMGQDVVNRDMFTTTDHTHTSLEGAKINAACLAEGIKELKNNALQKYFSKEANKLDEN